MSDRAGAAARVGLVVILAGTLLGWLVLELTSGRGFLSKEARFVARFSTIAGLTEGAEVRYEGVTVGRVESVEFSENPSENLILVGFTVKRSLLPRIDRHVMVELRSKGPLGDRLVELRRRDLPVEQALPEGSVLPSRDPFQFAPFVEGGEDLFADVRSISQSLKVITARLVAGDGVVGRLLEDKELAERMLSDLELVIARVREMVVTTSEGRNLMGTLLIDESLADEVAASLAASSRNVAIITSRLEAGEGLLGQAMRGDSRLSEALEDFEVAAANMRAFTERLEASESLAARLLFDPEYGQRLSVHLEGTLASLDGILGRIDRGEGSLGRFVAEPTIHDGLDRVLRGVEHSWFVRYLLRKKEKRGFREEVDRILDESEDPDRELLELMRSVLDEAEEASEGGEPGLGPSP